MNAALPSADEVDRLRAVIGAALGLDFDESKGGLLADALRHRAQSAGVSVPAYLARIEGTLEPQELRRLAVDLTITETSFFRNVEQMNAFSEVALPDRLAARGATRSLRILSAACASGEEPYSLAALVRDSPDATGWDVSIRGIDINSSALRKARAARYSSWSLRQTDAATRARLFTTDGDAFVLNRAIRDMVTFEERNLTLDDAQFWAPDSFDIIFCRNVIMYFARDTMRAVVARLARSLSPGGFMFLGHAETMRGLSTEFHLCHTHGSFYYQRKDSPAPKHRPQPSRPRTARTPPTRTGAATAEASAAQRSAWVDAIQGASDRIDALATRQRQPPGPAPAPVPAVSGARDLRDAVDAIGSERFSDAQQLLHALPAERARDPEVLLLRAVLHSHGGDLAAAEKDCSELLALDEMNAGAHYLMALCRESAGDDAGAAAQDRIAAHLDPGFAMPRLHLGRLARRAGDRDEARRQLREAMLLIEREDSAHLLLFGGGFSRSALQGLCRAELAACGDTA